jgi:hypothetical protein
VDAVKPAGGEFLEPLWRLDTVINEELENAGGREVAALLVGRAHLHGGDNLAPALDLCGGHAAGPAPVGTLRVLGTPLAAQQPVERGEPVIGHLKADDRMDRNYLAGFEGDHANAVLAAAGYNFRLLLRWLALLLRALIQLAMLTPLAADRTLPAAQNG